MRAPSFTAKIMPLLFVICGIVLVLLPFHAFLTVWASSNFGHYTLFRLWKEFLVLLLGLAVIWLFFIDKEIRGIVFKSKLTLMIFIYVILDCVSGFVAHEKHLVSNKALAYGFLDDLRFFSFFIICWALALKSNRLNKIWAQLIIWPAAVVIMFGLLQMSVLPANILVHFGYGPKTIEPFQTINNNPNYIRILSTLRGSDPLGTYLILPISALAVLLLKYPRRWGWAKLSMLVAAVIVLYGSYSRASWIGAVIACAIAVGTLISREFIVKHRTYFIAVAAIVVVLGISSVVIFAHSKRFQNVIFHTQTNSVEPISSDQAHLSALKDGLKQMSSHPFGQGPGSSGPASVYNRLRPPHITENYFLEIGEETGWIGMLLFIAINIYLALLLWRNRSSPFALVLFISLIGISFVNLLSLAWNDDTLSYLWWGLAGLSMASTPLIKSHSHLVEKSS